MAYIYPTNFTGRPSEKIPFEKIKKLKDENLKHLKNKPAFKYLKWRYENYKPFKS